jgi:hypothetical protein
LIFLWTQYSEPGTQNFRIAAIAAAVFLTATAAGHGFGAKSELLIAKLHSEFEESEEFCEFSAVHSLKSAVRICLAVVVFAVCESIETLRDVLVYSATYAWSQQLTAHYQPSCR